MKSGDGKLDLRLGDSRDPRTVKCDSGTVSVYEVVGDTRSPVAASTVSPGSPKDIHGGGSWDLVRSATTVNVDVS